MARIMSSFAVVIDGKEADVRKITHEVEAGCIEVVTIKIYPREYRHDSKTNTIFIEGLFRK